MVLEYLSKIFIMKTKTKRLSRTSEDMLTVRLPNKLLKSITKISKNVAMTRSNFVRTILQKEVDTHPLS
jgi:predicted DNA-binding protein